MTTWSNPLPPPYLKRICGRSHNFGPSTLYLVILDIVLATKFKKSWIQWYQILKNHTQYFNLAYYYTNVLWWSGIIFTWLTTFTVCVNALDRSFSWISWDIYMISKIWQKIWVQGSIPHPLHIIDWPEYACNSKY